MYIIEPVPPSQPKTHKQPVKKDRNAEIQRRYGEGESIPTLAREFGISNARVHQLLKRKS